MQEEGGRSFSYLSSAHQALPTPLHWLSIKKNPQKFAYYQHFTTMIQIPETTGCCLDALVFQVTKAQVPTAAQSRTNLPLPQEEFPCKSSELPTIFEANERKHNLFPYKEKPTDYWGCVQGKVKPKSGINPKQIYTETWVSHSYIVNCCSTAHIPHHWIPHQNIHWLQQVQAETPNTKAQGLVFYH